jgi:hypothetical protein
MMRARRWALALVITVMIVDAWLPDAAAATTPLLAEGPGIHAIVSP